MAAVSGDGHHAWRRKSVPEVIDICRHAGIAVIGGEVWGIRGRDILAAIPTMEHGTRSYGWSAPARLQNQSWPEYVSLCADLAVASLAEISAEGDVAADYRDRLFYHLAFSEASTRAEGRPVAAPGPSTNPVHQALEDMFNQAPIKHSLGMSIGFGKQGEAVFTIPPDERFFHGMGDVHGGMITTLMDNAGWFTAAAHYNRLVLTADLNIRLLEAARQQEITATGAIIRAGHTMAVVEMTATADGGRLIAKGTGAFTVTRRPVVRDR